MYISCICLYVIIKISERRSAGATRLWPWQWHMVQSKINPQLHLVGMVVFCKREYTMVGIHQTSVARSSRVQSELLLRLTAQNYSPVPSRHHDEPIYWICHAKKQDQFKRHLIYKLGTRLWLKHSRLRRGNLFAWVRSSQTYIFGTTYIGNLNRSYFLHY